MSGDTTASAIRKYHVATAPKGATCAPKGSHCKVCGVAHGNGWADIGYHFVVRKDGTVDLGRPVTRAGAHTEGANDTIGVCVTGDGDREPWSPQQWESVLRLAARYVQDAENVHGHREAPARLKAKPTGKTCPGQLVDMNEVRRRVALRLAGVA